MSLLPFVEWLANTPGSVALLESYYAYAVVESIHVWTLCLFVGLAAMLDLRLMGLVMRRVPMSQVASRLLPWTAAGFIVMVISGLVLFYGIPVRSYQNVFFRFKLALLVLAGLNAWVFHGGVYLSVKEWDLAPKPPRAARFAGACSLVLWSLIIVSGRMIAYNWFDCSKPQTATIRLLGGCVAPPS